MDYFTALFAWLIPLGPIGLFFASIIANASILFPIPIDVLLVPISTIDFFGLGFWSPLLLGFIVGLGASIGELTSYFVGLGGNHVLRHFNKSQSNQIKFLENQLKHKGFPLIIIFAFTPLPFDLIGVAAGVVRYPVGFFWLACLLGKIPRYILISYAGYLGLPFVLRFFGL